MRSLKLEIQQIFLSTPIVRLICDSRQQTEAPYLAILTSARGSASALPRSRHCSPPRAVCSVASPSTAAAAEAEAAPSRASTVSVAVQ